MGDAQTPVEIPWWLIFSTFFYFDRFVKLVVLSLMEINGRLVVPIIFLSHSILLIQASETKPINKDRGIDIPGG